MQAIAAARLIVVGVLLWVGRPVPAQVKTMSEADFTSAETCGECHREIYSQWSQSMHSQSFKDPLYRAVINQVMRQTRGKQKVFCLSCHAPIASVTGKLLDLPVPLDWESFSELESEGVTCDFCHTISGNENLGRNISVGAYVYPRQGATDVKYGRHPDTKNDIHTTQVSAFLTSAEFCAICHKFKHPVNGVEVQNTYQEWLRGPYSKQGVRCQDCHMPAYAGRTTNDGKNREEIHAHVFIGGHSEMVNNAATLSAWGIVSREAAGSRLTVTVNVRNHGAGHAIPTGLPGLREMRLQVDVVGPDGSELAQRHFTYGQRLVKRDGSDALPWEAFRLLEDNRIEPEQSKQNRFDVILPAQITGRVKIQAELFMWLISENMGRRLNLPVPVPVHMASTEASVSIQ